MGFGYEVLRKNQSGHHHVFDFGRRAKWTAQLQARLRLSRAARWQGVIDLIGEADRAPSVAPRMAIGDVLDRRPPPRWRWDFALLKFAKRTGEGVYIDASLPRHLLSHARAGRADRIDAARQILDEAARASSHPTGSPCGVFKGGPTDICFLIVQQHEMGRLWARDGSVPDLAEDAPLQDQSRSNQEQSGVQAHFRGLARLRLQIARPLLRCSDAERVPCAPV